MAYTTENLAAAKADAGPCDERHFDYWLPKVVHQGWVLRMIDYPTLRHELPHAMALIQVNHKQGEPFFYTSGSSPPTFGHHLVVLAHELVNGPFTKFGECDYRLHNGREYAVPFDGMMTEFQELPTGRYWLDVQVPLFKVEEVLTWRAHEDGFRVGTSAGFVYDSDELRAGDGFMGLVNEPSGKVLVWKLLIRASNLDEYRNEMGGREWVYFPYGLDQEVELKIERDPRPDARPMIEAWRQNVADMESDVSDAEDFGFDPKLDSAEGEDMETDDSPSETETWIDINDRTLADAVAETEEDIKVESDDEEQERSALYALPVWNPQQRYRSRHDLGARLVRRNGQTMVY